MPISVVGFRNVLVPQMPKNGQRIIRTDGNNQTNWTFSTEIGLGQNAQPVTKYYEHGSWQRSPWIRQEGTPEEFAAIHQVQTAEGGLQPIPLHTVTIPIFEHPGAEYQLARNFFWGQSGEGGLSGIYIDKHGASHVAFEGGRLVDLGQFTSDYQRVGQLAGLTWSMLGLVTGNLR